jgi:hypothetical protein
MQARQNMPDGAPAYPVERVVVVSDDVTLLLPPPKTRLLPPPAPIEITDDEFDDMVRRTLQTVGGTLLFKVRVAESDGEVHVAAAAVGTGRARQFMLLSLSVHGGRLSVEAASRSASPLARIAASYAGLLDVFQAAA